MEKITFISTANPYKQVGLSEAVLSGLAGEKGLFMPRYIPALPASFFRQLGDLPLTEIAFEVSRSLLHDYIPDDDLMEIIRSSLTYDIPLKQLDEDLYVLELFHGPTLAFKDTGARFMAALFNYLLRDMGGRITILVATSGDTGSAVANAFSGYKGIKVVVLYPAGRVSEIQEKMLNNGGPNVTAVEIDGDFDDCQRLVRECFSDLSLSSEMNLTSANSINFARLFPQTFYYFHAMSQLGKPAKPVAISIPSGNFGNLTAGVMASAMGLGISHFIASCNSNHPVVDYLRSGIYKPAPSIHTITNAMDVGNPNNFPRLLHLFGKRHEEITRKLSGYWFDDNQTRTAMREIHIKYGYTADPHGAVGFAGLSEFMKTKKVCGIFLETAHPVKFSSSVEDATGIRVEVPESLRKMLLNTGKPVRSGNKLVEFRKVLQNIAY